METAADSGAAIKPPRAQLLSQKAQKNLTIFLFLVPAFTLFLLFIVLPIFKSVYYSFFSWKGFGAPTDFSGLENFQQILKDKIFQKAIINGLLIIALSLGVQLPLSLSLAIMVGRDLPGRAFFRMIFFMPYVISEVITAIAWMGLYNPDPTRGLFNAILTLIPGVEPVAWLGDMKVVMPALFVVLTWKYFGLHMLLFLAGLQGISAEVEEAARIDGANGLQLIRYITLPMLGSTIRTSVYLSILGSLQQFILVWIMTKGGPVNASEVMATYMYRYGFVRFWYGYGSAVAIVMLLVSLIFSIGYLRIIRQPSFQGTE
jgi:raffinose/stachyose/melibiose transport system permease protein